LLRIASWKGASALNGKRSTLPVAFYSSLLRLPSYPTYEYYHTVYLRLQSGPYTHRGGKPEPPDGG
jgi:hypothetical protein